MNYKTKLSGIQLFAFDYDGVFTNGTVYLMPDGSMARTASARDGFAVQWAVKQGLNLAVVSGGKDEPVRWRMEKAGADRGAFGRRRQTRQAPGDFGAHGHRARRHGLHGRRHARPQSLGSCGTQLLPF